MIGKEDEGMELDWVESLCSSQDPDNDQPKLLGGPEKKATLHRSTCHLNQGTTSGNVTQTSRHVIRDAFQTHNLADSDGTSEERLFEWVMRSDPESISRLNLADQCLKARVVA